MTETYASRKILALLARPNWRGISTDRLIYSIQDAQDKLDALATSPVDAIISQRPPDCADLEWVEDHCYYYQQLILSLEAEIERRRQITYQGVLHTNTEIIQAIKNVLLIESVLEWYTEVFTHKTTWTYRCTLHGADNHPSGVIYREENRCWCYVCNKGGDIFDVVQLFERVDLPPAITKLARHVGLDTKPLARRIKKAGLNI